MSATDVLERHYDQLDGAERFVAPLARLMDQRGQLPPATPRGLTG